MDDPTGHRAPGWLTRGPLARIVLLCLLGPGLVLSSCTHPAAPPPAAGPPTGTITEFRPAGISATAADPVGIAGGPDGNLWFTDAGTSRIGRMAPDGTGFQETDTAAPAATPVAIASDGASLWFTENSASVDQVARIAPDLTAQGAFPTHTSPTSTPTDIVRGPDGRMWFTEFGNATNAHLGAIAPGSRPGTRTTDYPVTTPTTNPTGIATLLSHSPDLWFTEQGAGGRKIGEMATSGAMINEWPIGTGSGLLGITGGPDGNLWFTEQSGVIGKMTPSGVTTTFRAGITSPTSITAGPDGNLWFVDQGANAIGRITTSGKVTEFSAGLHSHAFSPTVPPTGIAAGPDGNIWFTEQGAAAALGRLTLAPALSLTSGALSFRTQAIGSASAPQVVTATSAAGGRLAITSAAVSGPDAADFTLSDTCSGTSLVPARPQCTVGVTFSPISGPLGTRTATLTFTGSTGTRALPLSGTAAGGVGFNRTTLTFGVQTVGTTSTPVTVALSNNSPAPVTVTLTAIAGAEVADFPITDHCAGTRLAPGHTCTVSLAFSPTATGPRAAALVVYDSAAAGAQTIALSGTGSSAGNLRPPGP